MNRLLRAVIAALSFARVGSATRICEQGDAGVGCGLPQPDERTDPLTSLPSLRAFEMTLAQSARKVDIAGQQLAVLLMNLDGFRAINQTLGHPCGNVVLREVAARLRLLGGSCMVARLAGDEFLVLLPGDPEAKEASAFAGRLIAEVARPFSIGSREASLSCSVGIAMYPQHGALSTMIAHASVAMRAAKGLGGAGYSLFERRMLGGVRDEIDLIRDLRVALERQQLELYYQPKIHAPTGEITGVEALLRWNHPVQGVVSPAVFIPLAERFGMINSLGRWVIGEACRQARAWRDQSLRMRIAINLSMHQLRQADLAAQISDALQQHQINPDLLTCEVTESCAMEDIDVTIAVLTRVAELGVHISIDDFGTGHSSLSYLRKLPAHELKIDRSFVLDLEGSSDARKVAFAVINLAKSLNLKVVAEGVETEGQESLLRDFGCDQLQGFLFANPMTAKALYLWASDEEGPRKLKFRDSLFKDSSDTMPAPLGS